MAFLYVGIASAEVDFKILDTFPWPHAARCTLDKGSLLGGWELENGEFIFVKEFKKMDGNKLVSVEKYNTSLERVARGWGEYTDSATVQVDMYGIFKEHSITKTKVVFGFYSPVSNNGSACLVKTPYLLSVDANATAENVGISGSNYYQMQRFEDLSLILK